MQVSLLNLRGQQASFVDWQGENKQQKSGQEIKAHFYGANGYPPEVYRPLFDQLQPDLRVESLHMRAQWPNIGLPPRSVRWRTYANDLIHFLESRHSQPIVGMGHSMGASSTIIAAAKRPELFSQLILMEPAALSAPLSILATMTPFSLRQHFMQPGKATLKRRYQWQNKAAFRQKCQDWNSLSGLSEKSLDAFSNSAVVEADDGVELAFPREWEAHNFFSPESLWSSLKKVKCPITVIRGEASIFFTDAMWKTWQRLRPQDNILKLDNYGHLLPLQTPELCANIIKSTINKAV